MLLDFLAPKTEQIVAQVARAVRFVETERLHNMGWDGSLSLPRNLLFLTRTLPVSISAPFLLLFLYAYIGGFIKRRLFTIAAGWC